MKMFLKVMGWAFSMVLIAAIVFCGAALIYGIFNGQGFVEVIEKWFGVAKDTTAVLMQR